MNAPNAAPQPPGAWRRFRRNPAAIAALALLVLIIALAIASPALFHYDPETTTKAQFNAPASGHIFGTDVNGRDVLSRVVQGARISLLVGMCGALISFFIGTTYGMISGYHGGKLDTLMMRFVDIMFSIPRLLLIIIAIYTFDRGLKDWMATHGLINFVGFSRIILIILTLGFNEWLNLARIVRGQVLSLREQQFVLAARALGQSHTKIIVRHLLPNLIGLVIVYLTLTIPAVILDESFLSFIGLGVQAPQAAGAHCSATAQTSSTPSAATGGCSSSPPPP